MKRSRRVTPYGFLAACVLTSGVLAAFHGAAAQEQEKFTNLKVLPKDVSPEELRATMGQFTRALGVRCNFCHAAKAGEQRLDFALDDKPEKKTARAMMQMTHDLNDKYLGALEDRGNPPVKVGCFTCHHGTNRPRTLQDVLKTAYAHGGVDSTRARYSSLHDRYYGSAAYDFGEVPLADVAQSLADSGHVADAVNLLAMNVDMNPKSTFIASRFTASATWPLSASDCATSASGTSPKSYAALP